VTIASANPSAVVSMAVSPRERRHPGTTSYRPAALLARNCIRSDFNIPALVTGGYQQELAISPRGGPWLFPGWAPSSACSFRHCSVRGLRITTWLFPREGQMSPRRSEPGEPPRWAPGQVSGLRLRAATPSAEADRRWQAARASDCP
jgi:hypothetical protein